jgi:hypothetical protein
MKLLTSEAVTISQDGYRHKTVARRKTGTAFSTKLDQPFKRRECIQLVSHPTD